MRHSPARHKVLPLMMGAVITGALTVVFPKLAVGVWLLALMCLLVAGVIAVRTRR